MEKSLTQAEKIPAQAARAIVVRAEMLLGRDRPAEAAARLKQAREEFEQKPPGDQAPLWVASIRLLAGQGDVAGAKKLLAEAPPAVADRAELLGEKVALASAGGKKDDRALAEVETKLAALPPPERVRLLARLAATAFRKEDKAEGQRLWRKALAEKAEVAERAALLDLALEVGDKAMIDAILDELRRQEGADGTWWRCGEAAKVLALPSTQPQALAEAALRLDEVRQRRPYWSRAVLLGAQLDELKGDANRALEGYERAFELGDPGGRQPWLVQRLVQLLRARGRDADADAKLRKYELGGGQLSGELLRLAAESALRVGGTDRAVSLAAPVVARGWWRLPATFVGWSIPACSRSRHGSGGAAAAGNRSL